MAGQTVYVLTTILDTGDERPVAVVTDEHVANEWVRSGSENDWIPLELDDTSLTAMSRHQVTPFSPKKKQPAEDAIRGINENLQKQNASLQEVIQLLQKRIEAYEKRQGYKQGSPLLQRRANTAVLYHGTSSKVLKAIKRGDNTMPPPSYWGTEEIAQYYAEVVAEEDGSEQVILAVPMSAFSPTHLTPDDNSIAEPLTYTLGSTEEELYDRWEESDQDWEASLEIYGSVKYNAIVNISGGKIL